MTLYAIITEVPFDGITALLEQLGLSSELDLTPKIFKQAIQYIGQPI